MAEAAGGQGPRVAVGEGIFVREDCELPSGMYRVVAHSEIYGGRLTLKSLPSAHPQEKKVRRRNLGLYEISQNRLGELLEGAVAARVGIVEPVHRLRAADQLKGKRKQIYESRAPVLRAMLEPDTLHRLLGEGRSRELGRLAQIFHIDAPSLLRLFDRLLDFGLNWHGAAMTSHDRCGRKAGRDYARKQGRKRRHVANGRAPDLCGINATAQFRQAMEIFALSRYRGDLTLQRNFRNFKATYGFKEVHQLADGTVVREELPQDQFISYEQFRYHVNKFLAAHKADLERQGKPIAGIRDVRPALGDARERLVAPGYRLIIDSTLADVYLVSSWNRSRIIGRPVVYVVIDGATSTIVGLYVTLYAPSATQAKTALFRALTDKSAWLDRFCLRQYAHLFPRAPIPIELVYDRGELHSAEGAAVRAALMIGAGVPAPYMAEWKAIVERSFRTSNENAIHWVPGSTQGRLRERGEKDVRLDAVLTLHEFTQLMLHNVFLWNLRGRITAKMHPQALAENTAPSPVSLFDWGLRNLHGAPRFLEKDQAIHRLIEAKPFDIGDRGIFCENLRWTAPWMQSEVYSLLEHGKRAGLLFQDPDRADAAFVQLGTEQHLRQVDLAAGWPLEKDYFPEDVLDYVVYEGDHRNIHALNTVKFETTLDQASLAVVQGAKRQTRQALQEAPVSKSGRISAIRDNRAAEMAAAQALPVAARPVLPPPSGAALARTSTTQIGNLDLHQFVQSLD